MKFLRRLLGVGAKSGRTEGAPGWTQDASQQAAVPQQARAKAGQEQDAARGADAAGAAAEAAVLLEGRRVARTAVPVVGASIVDLAKQNKVDWLYYCRKGTCARCRCHVSKGMAHLTAPSEAELARLTPEEIAQGYRLGCQARIASAGHIAVKHAPYV